MRLMEVVLESLESSGLGDVETGEMLLPPLIHYGSIPHMVDVVISIKQVLPWLVHVIVEQGSQYRHDGTKHPGQPIALHHSHRSEPSAYSGTEPQHATVQSIEGVRFAEGLEDEILGGKVLSCFLEFLFADLH